METQVFWDVIANYNVATWMIQILKLFCIVIGLSIAYKKNNARVMKVVLGIINLYIAIIFFGVYGTEPIQKFFAMPLYIGIGVLFLKDAYCETDTVNKPNKLQVCIYIYIVYIISVDITSFRKLFSKNGDICNALSNSMFKFSILFYL